MCNYRLNSSILISYRFPKNTKEHRELPLPLLVVLRPCSLQLTSFSSSVLQPCLGLSNDSFNALLENHLFHVPSLGNLSHAGTSS